MIKTSALSWWRMKGDDEIRITMINWGCSRFSRFGALVSVAPFHNSFSTTSRKFLGGWSRKFLEGLNFNHLQKSHPIPSNFAQFQTEFLSISVKSRKCYPFVFINLLTQVWRFKLFKLEITFQTLISRLPYIAKKTYLLMSPF